MVGETGALMNIIIHLSIVGPDLIAIRSDQIDIVKGYFRAEYAHLIFGGPAYVTSIKHLEGILAQLRAVDANIEIIYDPPDKFIAYKMKKLEDDILSQGYSEDVISEEIARAMYELEPISQSRMKMRKDMRAELQKIIGMAKWGEKKIGDSEAIKKIMALDAVIIRREAPDDNGNDNS